jgi:Leucine-rich repeat (LRR) protein
MAAESNRSSTLVKVFIMKISIGNFEIVGHRPGAASRVAHGVAQPLTRAERVRDCLPMKWRRTPIIESMVRASLDEVIATPPTAIAVLQSENTNTNTNTNTSTNALMLIDSWVEQAPQGHQVSYQRVAEQIKACWESGETQLSLRGESITSLPPLPPTLTSLDMRDCASLTTTPDVSSMTALTNLTIFNCAGITTVPHLSGCHALSSLDIRDCAGLTNAPNIAGCTALSNLSIRGCPSLTAMPDVSSCTALSRLDMRNCPLTSLPEDILALPQHCHILLTVDHLSDSVRNRLEATMNAPEYAGPRIEFDMGRRDITWLRPLSDEITTWMFETRRSDNTNSQINWDDHSEESTQPFSTFLARLRETQDYRGTQTKAQFQQRVCSVIDQLQKPDHTELRALCFSQAAEAISTCGDRVALAFLDMETACATRRIECDVNEGAYDNNLSGLVALGRGMHRLQTLQTISREKVATLHFVDEIEVHLGYLVNLSQEFALPVRMQSMLYPRCACLSDTDIDAARQRLSTDENHNDLVAYLSNWHPMDLFLKRHHAQVFAEVSDAVSARVIEQKQALQGQFDGLDPASDDYEQRCRELIKQFNTLDTTISAKLKGDLIREKVNFSLLD